MPVSARPALHPLRLLAALVAGALVVMAAFISKAAPGYQADPDLWRQPLVVRADTDSVAIALDSTAIRPALADTDSVAVLPDTGRAVLYLPRIRRDHPTASLFLRKRRPFSVRTGRYWQHELQLDSTSRDYTARETISKKDVRIPLRLDFETYRQERLKYDLADTWRTLSEQRARQRATLSRGGVGFNIVVPGGRQSAFTTIFGKPEVDLRVNGQADIKAGFDYRKSDQQVAFSGRATQIDPDFKQDLRLGIVGSIGDKLRVDVNYDSQNQFEYQNQLKLQYTGYEDEIIQSIEAGNVFLQTPSSLIRGGQSLFGIKSEFQIGGVHLTTVMSQQEGQSNSLDISGGSESTNFDLKPTDYDDNTHFFLSYYFRNRWEDALSDPPNIRVANGFERIAEIEIWRLQPTTPEEQNVRQVVAVVDLGEGQALLTQADAYARVELPDNAIDQYDDSAGGEVDAQLRNGSATPGSYLESTKQLTASDYQIGKFKKLERGRDYVFDEVLGYLSLRQRLQESEALAVSFRYVANGRTFQVGDFSTQTGGSDGGQNEDKLVMKLIRPVQLRQPAPDATPPFNPAAWYLELRNIYRFPGRGLNPNEFELQVFFEPPGKTAAKTLPGVGEQQTLLQLLGLDRLNEDQALKPDDRFDYLVNYTIDPGEGLLVFPYLQPFGGRINRLIDQNGEGQEELKSLYVFSTLYNQKKANAKKDSQLDVYRIRGSYKGSVQDFYDLRAYAGLVPGSVRVSSGGTPLSEGADFVVDYAGGTVNITNPAFLTAGRDINITYEQNSFFNIQKKTLLGARADYSLDERLALGATVMRLSQKSPIDKFRIGEEPISNTIWGMDGTLKLEPRWLTRAIDALPLVQTKATSSVSLTGEFAQLRPNHTETIAFDRTRRELRKNDRDFYDDELRGISYIDDFEGFENTFSLKQPGTWGLSAPPDSIGALDRDGPLPGSQADSLRTTWRGNLAWYQLNANMLREISASVYNPESINIVEIQDVFPNRDTGAEVDRTLTTLDYYFNPSERGPYNYTTELQNFLDNPKNVWGGITQRLPEGFTDFSLKNIDFVEFVFRPFPENPDQDAGRSARLYLDLGSISEDVLPNEKLNNEDGLSLSTIGPASVLPWGRTPNGTQNSAVDIDETTLRTEDLGLDGLASYGGDYPPFATEQGHFSNFLDALNAGSGDSRYQAEVAKAQIDPSGDDYHYFGDDRYYTDSRFFPNGATFQQRFSRYFAGHELNGFETQNKIADNTSVKRGNSRFPDSEDRNLNSTVDTDNSYFQYEIPLSKAALDSLAAPTLVDDYVVGEIADQNGVGTGWYQIRIPVQNFTRQVGNIQDFSLIESMRLWTTGHQVPITMRFATLELVGSQWQKSEQITMERSTISDTTFNDTRLTISSINNEENADLYEPPIGTIISQIRVGASARTQNAREQAMVLRVEDLRPGKQRGVFKPQSQGLDLLKYAHLRMFTHLHGSLGDGTNLADLPKEVGREKVRLFVRLGSNETNDYYEYEQPLTPSRETTNNSDEIWQTNQDFNGEIMDLNSMNIELGALNQLKVTRDRLGFPTDSVFWNVRNDTLVSPDAPDAAEFAPPGTRIGIKGTPSLSRVTSIVIGIRNPADSTSNALESTLEDVIVWVNELRVTGYDENNGWSGLANADFQLADLARIKANFQTQTDGFGSLSSSLDERDQNNIRNWSVTTELNAHKVIPERFGWSLPVSLQVQSNTSTPRFSPTRGDVRLDELLAQIEDRSDLEAVEKEAAKDEAIQAAQTSSFTRSVTTRIGKQGSRSKLLRNTIDGISANYSYTDTEGRTPSLKSNNSWRWSSTLSYRFTTRRPRTVRPFWFLEPIPILGLLGDLRFNYLPQSMNASGTATRNFTESKERALEIQPDTSGVPELVRFPLREKHSFAHNRSFSYQHNPFGFLNLSFDTSTNQSLNALGADTLRIEVSGLNPDTGRDSTYVLDRLQIVPAGRVLNRAFTRAEGLRTERHEQRFTGTFRPQLTNSKALNWIAIQDVVYGTNFSWQNGPLGRNTGASVSNKVDLRGGLTLRIQEFWRKFEFYRNIEEKQRQIDRDKQAARQKREQEKRRQEQEKKKAEEDEGLRLQRPPPPEEEEIELIGEDEEELIDQQEGNQEEGVQEEEEKAPDRPGVETTEAGEQQAQKEGGGFRLPLPSLSSLFRRTLLAITGIRDFSITYTGNRNSSSTNVGRPIFNNDGGLEDVNTSYSLIDAFKGNGPSVGYRFGLNRQIGLEDRVIDPSLQVSDVLDNSNRFQGRTALNPSQTLQINLTWNLEWTDGRTFTFRPNLDDNNVFLSVDTTLTESGTNKASILAFGASYLDMFQQQLDAYRDDLASAAEATPAVLADENGDGRVVLTNGSVVDDFGKAFVRGNRTLGKRGLLPFPMPNWTINYSGLSKWPIIRSIVQNMTLRHGYNADYSNDFRTNLSAVGDDSTATFDLGTQRILYTVSDFETSNVRINERFQPLVGVDLSFKGNIQTNFAWSKSNAYSLSTSNFEVSESKTDELTLSASWQKTGMTLPFFGGKRLNNRVSFNLTVSRSTTSDQRFSLRRALTAAVIDEAYLPEDALTGDNVSLVTAHTRLTVSPQISYQFSNRVSANFTLRYEKFDSKDSRQPSATNIQGNFNIRVSIQN